MLDHLGHPAFAERGGLGKTTQQIYDLLQLTSNTTVADLAERSGHAKRQVRSALRLLREHDLARNHGHRWKPEDGSLDQTAIRLGCADRPIKQRQRYEAERAGAAEVIK